MKNKLINDVELLLENIKTENVSGLVDSIKDLELDRHFSPIIRFGCSIIISTIKNYIIKNKKASLRVKRKGEYNIETTDVYIVKNDILYRNGSDTKWTSFGKLYTAYKQIMNDI